MVWSEAKWSGLKARMVQSPEQCVGKTITRSYEDADTIGFLFDDGSFFLAVAGASIETFSPKLTPGVALDLKLISPEEYHAFRGEQLELEEARERQRHEELKKKFCGGGTGT